MSSSNEQIPQVPLPPAPLWRRLAAMFYDTLLVMALMMVTTGLYHTAVNKWLLKMDDAPLGFNPFLASLLVFVSFGFFAYFWTRKGQTLGMQVWRVRIQNKDGGAISLWQCLLRYMIAIPAIGLALAGVFWMMIDKEGKTWQDRYSMSEVVLLPKGFYGLK
ncbi:RDD family protein [Kistimonas asteriae]|uniref:RDD family protein n=1 Tax=Kistimonas asteriae TaxID=517724 RepID=UPI001BAD8A37|nr:RDD family protein [Kistimonas asteriae]